MVTHGEDLTIFVLLMGGIIILSVLVRYLFRRAGIPSLVGFLILGFIIRLANLPLTFLTEPIKEIFEFLGTIGIVFLLFRVGLESNITGLIRQLKRATIIWFGNVAFSGGVAYVTAHYLLGLAVIPSLFVTIALTATSVAVSVGTWEEAKAIKSPIGELLIDSAEMDDVSGVVLMALLFAVVPVMHGDTEASLMPVAFKTLGLFLAKLVGFGAFCYLFSRYLERPMTGLFKRLEPGLHCPMLVIIGVALAVAALAGLIGFSVAIGAFFAGLIFSRDPEAVKGEAHLSILYELFPPFFFINVGLSVDPNTLTAAIWLGLILLLAAILGKVAGNGLPTLISSRWTDALLLGVSMIPRAEIAMVIMHHGLLLGDWAVPTSVYSGMVLVTLSTAVISPFIIRFLLKRWPPIKYDARKVRGTTK
jgi:Kef-type K+ transport system membrane component KefB